VRNAKRKKAAADDKPRWFVLQALGWSHKDAVAFGVIACAATAILVNGLMFQRGPHPAPMFKDGLVAAPKAAPKSDRVAALPRSRPVEAGAAKSDPASARPNVEVVADIQRELTRRGFYDGVVDGRYGPRTDSAIRDFEQAAGQKASTEPNEALLATIKRSNVKAAKPPPIATSGIRPPQPLRDPAAEGQTPSKRVLAVQRALAEFGYGQIKPTGTVNAETKAAIEKFERERKLPVTGQVSDRVTRELAAITGRPLE